MESKEIGYAVGTGFMVGAPYQTVENLADDLLFIKELDPQMVGIGPFVPHHDTRFKEFPSGSVELTTYLVSILRLMNPHLLLPSTTALGTIDPRGRVKRNSCRCKCCYAEPFSCCSKKRLFFI